MSLHNLGLFEPWAAKGRNHKSSGWAKYFLFTPEPDPDTPSPKPNKDEEHEIFYTGNTVFWSAGQTIKKSFTLNHPIVHVVWATFEPNKARRDLCVLHTEGITVFCNDGKQYQVVLPCAMDRLWPLPMGIMMERSKISNPVTHSTTTLSPANDSSALMDDGIPTIFSLLHPLEEVKPVSFLSHAELLGRLPVPPINQPQNLEPAEILPQDLFICEPYMRIVFSSVDAPLMILYDERVNTHSLWLLKKEIEDEKEYTYDALIQRRKQARVNKSLDEDFDKAEATRLWFELGSRFDDDRAPLEEDLLDYQIKSAIFIERVQVTEQLKQSRYHDSVFVGRPNNAFFLASERGELIIAVVIPDEGHLIGYILRPGPNQECPLVIGDVFITPCLDAQPLTNVLPSVTVKLDEQFPRELTTTYVTLSASGKLELYALQHKICQFQAPSVPETVGVASPIPAPDTAGPAASRLSTDMSIGSESAQMDVETPIRTPKVLTEARRSSFLPVSPDAPFSPMMSIAAASDMDEMMMSPLEHPGSPRFMSTPSRLNRNVQPMAFSTPDPSHQVRSYGIVALEQAVSDRFNIRMQDESVYRLRLRLSLLKDDPLVADALLAIKAVLPTEVFFQCLSELIEIQRSEEASPQPPAPWAIFSTYISTAINTLLQSNEKEKRQPADDDWEYLLSSDFHHHRLLTCDSALLSKSAEARLPRKAVSNSGQVYRITKEIAPVLYSLHLLYESYKLNTLCRYQGQRLGVALAEWCAQLGWQEYRDHYARDIVVCRSISVTSSPKITPIRKHPPCIYSWLILTLRGHMLDFPILERAGTEPLDRIRKICRLYQLLVFRAHHPSFSPPVKHYQPSTLSSESHKRNKWHARVKETLLAMSNEISSSDMETYPFGIFIPLREVMQWARHHPSNQLTESCFTLIGRQDLAFMNSGVSALKGRLFSSDISARPTDIEENLEGVNWAPSSTTHPGPTPALVPYHKQQQNAGRKHISDPDGVKIEHTICLMRFARDNRLVEVGKLLRSSRPMKIDIREEGLSDRDLMAKQQLKLLVMLSRNASLPVGRGMFTLGTDVDAEGEWIGTLGEKSGRKTLSLKTERVYIPPLCITGRAAGSNTTVSLDPNILPTNTLHWPEFHNGVAAGLRISPEQAEKITNTWISYNKPKGEVSTAHAGLLLAFGLLGHLRVLAITKIYEYLTLSSSSISVALLLGLSACSYGTSLRQVEKILSVHIPALQPPSSADMEVAPIVQAAALLGVGLLFAGTAQRRMAEILLSSLPGKAGDIRTREAYSFSAGAGLGLVVLGKGESAVGLTDLNIPERLLTFVHGGRISSTSQSSTDSSASYFSTVHQLPGGVPSKGPNNRSGPSKEQSPLVLEGDFININLTAPGALYALALMFLKTNNKRIASRLQVPDTLFLLEQTRPDLLLLRTLATNVILWDDIAPTETWLINQLPPVLRSHAPQFETNPALISADENAIATIKLSYTNIIAGACFALALKYAGTSHQGAMQTIKKQLHIFLKLNNLEHNKVHKASNERCISVAALSLSVVMAGSGDLDVLRILRKLRKRCTAEQLYGDHMAIGMAIGLLFLGGGRFTLGNSDKAVAALMISLYPYFPQSFSDNRYHLQAYRHLYVLAVEPRCLSARDVDTMRPVYVPVDVYIRPQTKEGSKMQNVGTPSKLSQAPDVTRIRMITPCLLPPLDWIVQIDVVPSRYWPLSLKPNRNAEHKAMLSTNCGGTLLVKRKAGAIPYTPDSSEYHSILYRTAPVAIDYSIVPELRDNTSLRQTKSVDEFVRTYSGDPNILAFANHFCTLPRVDANGGSHLLPVTPAAKNYETQCFFTRILYECLAQDKVEMLQTYLTINHILTKTSQEHACVSLDEIVNVQIAAEFYQHLLTVHRMSDSSESDSKVINEEEWQPLLDQSYLANAISLLREKYSLLTPSIVM